MTMNDLILMEAIINNPNIDHKLISYLTIRIEHWNNNQIITVLK